MNVVIKKTPKGEILGVFGPYYFPDEAHSYSVELQKAYPESHFVISSLTNFRMLCENNS
jgi:hypothetical protein